MENEILEAISHIKNVNKKSPTAEKILNHISKTSASNIDLTFVNKTIKQLISKNKINDNFKIIVEPKNGILNQSIDEVQTEEFNETLDGSPTAPQFVDEKELEILIIATIATLKIKNKKCGPEEVFNLVKVSLETGLTRENFNECLGNLISKKSVKHITINSRECLSLPKDDSNNHDDSNNNDDTISHDNTVSHDDTCVLKEDFNSYQVKCIKELQNVKEAFLKKLSDIEQNLEKNLEKKEYDEKYERLLNQLEKENLLLKDEIIRKDKIINNLLDNFSNRVPEHSDHVTYKNTEVRSQTDQQNLNNMQTSTASNNYHEKENDKNHKIRNFSQNNSKTCDKIHVNKNANNNTKAREPLDQADKKSESEEIIEQSNPNTLHEKRPCTIIVGDSTVKHLHGKSIANKTSRDNIILVKPFPGARTKAMKHYVSPDLEKKPDLVILHTGTNDLKSDSSPEEIANEITSLALSVKEKGHQIAVSGILPRGDRFSKKAKDVNDYLEIQYKEHNIDVISHENINTRSHLNQDRLHPNRKGQYMMGNNFSTFINNFLLLKAYTYNINRYVWRLYF